MSVSTIKKNDTVIVISGTSAGRTGKVLEIDAVKQRALVEGVNLRKKCLRKSQENPQGGIIEKEAPLALSNLMLHCPTCKKGVRTGRTRDGRSIIRKCKLCSHTFDS